MNDLKINLLKKNYNRNLIILSIVIFSSLSLRLFLIPIDVPIKLDGIDYFSFAFEFSKNGIYPNGILHTNDGWSIFLSPFFSIVGSSDFMNLIYTQRIVSIILSTMTIIPVYYLCKKFTSSSFSLVGTSIFAFHPRLIENSILGITESLFIFLVTLTLFFIFSKNDKLLFFGFITASFSSIVRYEGLMIFIPLSIFFFIKYRNNKKHYLRYILFIGIALLILLPIANLRSQDYEMDGFMSHLFSGIQIISCTFQCDFEDPEVSEDPNYIQTKNLYSNSLISTVKYLIWVSIPFFLILTPIGVYQFFKSRNNNLLYLLLFGFFLLIPASYAYGREIQEIRYLFVLFPILSIFSANAFNFNKKFLKNNWFLFLIPVFFIFSIFYFSLYQDDYVFQKEIYFVTKYIVDEADGVNIYNGNGYVKVATLENNWPNPLTLNEKGRTIYDVNKIPYDNSKTLEEFLINSKNKNLTHLVILENNKNPFLDDLFKNYKNYQYLTKTFDSADFEFENRILVFKINYNLFETIS